MPMAYVLLNTEIGSETEVIKALKKLEGVESAFNLWGIYDIIASIKTDSMEKLTDIINKRLHEIAKIHSKLTMLISETRNPST